jgi:hypothetical protein
MGGGVGACLDFWQKKATARVAEGGELPIDLSGGIRRKVSGSVEIGHKFYMEWLVNRIRKSYGSNSRPMMFTVLDVVLARGPVQVTSDGISAINRPVRF